MQGYVGGYVGCESEGLLAESDAEFLRVRGDGVVVED